ncbi:MAG: mechanosensitive ion channel domain-containing protein [Desulfatiglans sp.]|jgi:small conductance mechanosensitive channel|nr:mechanosensitive ion channel [Thermodesulfobacteriota bacterium]MEE4351534.1 mechanosensitive ion channel domain-containing protein [Desulfatiglans sp.]
MESVGGQLTVFIATYGMKVIGAIIILVLGRIAAGIGRKIVRKVLERSKTDVSIVSFVSSLTYILILVFAVLAALAKFGIQTASFVAVLGAAGFAVGFALQGSLANFAAGVLILIFRPYKAGDFIDAAGVAGTVKDIQLFTTVLATPDNIKIMVPNGKILGDVIKNVNGYDTRRIDLVIGIGYTSDIQKADGILMGLVKEDGRILSDPAPQVAVSELADSSVNFVVRPWVKKEDYWAVKFDLTRKIKGAFDENDIEIPFPQQVVHMMKTSD